MNPSIFRMYDVRGIADADLTSDVAFALGRAYATVIRRDGGRRICLGRDCRDHGLRLRDSFRDGVLRAGLDVIDVGIVPSPLLYFAVWHHDADGGVQITGSHNPAEYNGFKMMRGKGSLWGDQILELKAMIEAEDFETGEGQTSESPILDAYVRDVAGRLELSDRKLKVAVDAGNGVGGPAALALLEQLGVEVIPLFMEMDATFPNHHPDPTVEENLEDVRAAVLEHGCDLGIAYDGDADRIGVVDEAGQILWGDRLLVVLAREVLEQVPGAAIVAEVKCSQTLFDAIEAMGGRPIMSAVGHSIIKDRMKKEDAALAGEMSGHIFYRHRWYGFDDAIYTTGRLLELLSRDDRPLSAHLIDVPETHATPELRVDCPEEVKFRVVAQAVEYFKARYDVVDIDGARVNFGDGWGLIRASNTQPVIVLRAEADTPEALARIRSTLEGFIADHAGG